MNEQDKYMKIESPCISVCTYNNNKFCIGCKRHLDEIFDWLDYSDEMRTAIMKDLADRDIDKK